MRLQILTYALMWLQNLMPQQLYQQHKPFITITINHRYAGVTYIGLLLHCQMLGAFNQRIEVTASAVESKKFLSCKQLLVANSFQCGAILLISYARRWLPVFDADWQNLKDTTTSYSHIISDSNEVNKMLNAVMVTSWHHLASDNSHKHDRQTDHATTSEIARGHTKCMKWSVQSDK